MGDLTVEYVMREQGVQYLSKEIYLVISKRIPNEISNEYARFSTRELAEQWIKDMWGDEDIARVEVDSLITEREVAP